MKKNLFVAIFLLGIAIVNAQNIKELKVSTSYLVYPKIPIENIDLSKVKIEFAHGEVKITDEKSVMKETNVCKAKGASLKDAKALEVFYYKIKYYSPEGIVRITNENGEVVYAKITSDKFEDYDLFGKDNCYFLEAILESAYKKMKTQNDSMLLASVDKDLYTKTEKFVNQSLVFYYQPEGIEVHYVKDSKDFQYPELLEAANMAIKGYELLKENYTSQDGKSNLTSAIKIWEAAVSEKDLNNKDAKINKKVAGRLYKNLAQAYAYLQNYDEAGKNINEALAIYPNTSNNSTVEWENLREWIYEAGKCYKMNKSAEVKVVKLENMGNAIKLVNRGVEEYPNFKSDYTAFTRQEFGERLSDAKKAQEEAVASGMVNKYQDKVLHSVAQGYMLSLPSTFGATSLAEIQEAMKKLEEFPIEACDLVQLNQLILKNNKIKSIPADIKKLVNLKRLDLSKNEITELPIELGELKELNTLILKGNPLKAGEVEKIQKLLPDCSIKL